MNCLIFENYLQKRLDGENVSFPEDLLLHKEECTECRSRYFATVALERILAKKTSVRPPAELADRIVQQVCFAQKSRVRLQRRWALTSAVAAAVMASLVAFNGWEGRPHSSVAVNPFEKTPVALALNTESVLDSFPAPAPLQSTAREAGDALVSLFKKAADETIGSTGLFMPDDVSETQLADLSLFQGTLDPSAKTLKEASQGFTEGLEPVALSAQRAFDWVVREVPPMGTGGK